MPILHEKAVLESKRNSTSLTRILCVTDFETEIGTKGRLYLQRWLDDTPSDKFSIKFRYCASINLNLPRTNTWCGAIDLSTTRLDKIQPWIRTTAKQCNEQLKLPTLRIIKEALADLDKQFKEFLPTLQNEDDEVKKRLAKIARKA